MKRAHLGRLLRSQIAHIACLSILILLVLSPNISNATNPDFSKAQLLQAGSRVTATISTNQQLFTFYAKRKTQISIDSIALNTYARNGGCSTEVTLYNTSNEKITSIESNSTLLNKQKEVYTLKEGFYFLLVKKEGVRCRKTTNNFNITLTLTPSTQFFKALQSSKSFKTIFQYFRRSEISI